MGELRELERNPRAQLIFAFVVRPLTPVIRRRVLTFLKPLAQRHVDQRCGQVPAIGSMLVTRICGICATPAALAAAVVPVALSDAPAGAVGGTIVPATCTRLPTSELMSSLGKRR
jgi:hypothetical protein